MLSQDIFLLGCCMKATMQVPCQGLDFGYVIAKRPPLSDFAFSPTRTFKIDEALEHYKIYKNAPSALPLSS